MMSSIVRSYINTNPRFHQVSQLMKNTFSVPIYIDHVAIRSLHKNNDAVNHFAGTKLILQPEVYKFPSFQATARWYKLEENGAKHPLNRLFITTYKGKCFPFIRNLSDYKQVHSTNPYLAWTTLFDQHLNHIALEVPDIELATEECIKQKIPMNTSNGLYKVSKDGLLIQTSTMAIPMKYTFKDSEETTILPYTFVELVQRKKDANGILRDGFEQENALHIYSSTN